MRRDRGDVSGSSRCTVRTILQEDDMALKRRPIPLQVAYLALAFAIFVALSRAAARVFA